MKVSVFNLAKSAKSDWSFSGGIKKEDKKLVNSYKINLFDPRDTKLIKKAQPKLDRKSENTFSQEKKKSNGNLRASLNIPEKRNKSEPKLRPKANPINYLKRPDPNIISSDQIPIESRQSLLKMKSTNDYLTINSQNVENVQNLVNDTKKAITTKPTINYKKNKTQSLNKPIIKTVKQISKLQSNKGNLTNPDISSNTNYTNPSNINKNMKQQLKETKTFTLKKSIGNKIQNSKKDLKSLNSNESNSNVNTLDLNFNFSPIAYQTQQENLFSYNSPVVVNLDKSTNDKNYETISNNNFINSILSDGKAGFINNKYRALIDQFFLDSRAASVGSNISREEKIKFFEGKSVY